MENEDIRALAAATYNQAFEEVESQERPAYAVEMAAASLHLWRQLAMPRRNAIGCWLYSRALAKAGAGALALEVAEEMLRHSAEVEDAPDWLVASCAEGYARALIVSGDPRAGAAYAQAEQAIAAIEDEKARELISGQFADLRVG